MRVSNTLHRLVTYWDLSKFECRLEQMREIYQTRGSACSLDEAGTGTSPSFTEDPFNDPADGWAPSPLRQALPLETLPKLWCVYIMHADPYSAATLCSPHLPWPHPHHYLQAHPPLEGCHSLMPTTPLTTAVPHYQPHPLGKDHTHLITRPWQLWRNS